MTSTPTRPDERRDLRRAQRRRQRGGSGRGPVVLQRLARAFADGWRRLVAGVRRAVRGDRPLILLLLAAMVLAVMMLSGPFQRWMDARDRVEGLSTKASVLDQANAELEQRQQDLEDPTTIELLAREQQGFIRPGEVPYTLIPPEVERPRIAAPRESAQPGGTPPWYRRAWETLHGWLG